MRLGVAAGSEDPILIRWLMPLGSWENPSEPQTSASATGREIAVRKREYRGRVMTVPVLFDPDTLVDAETEEMAASAIPDSTRETYRREWHRFMKWCGEPANGIGHPRNHLPATVQTVCKYIKDHWHMTRTTRDGRVVLAGRYGRPYAPSSVGLAVAVVSIVHQWAGLASPTRHPVVARQLKGYETKWSKAGYRPDVSHAISPEENLDMTRACDLMTVQGIRNAAMLRLQYELGARASELCNLTFADLRWETPDRLNVHIELGKGHKSRDCAVEADLDDVPDLCALKLLRGYLDLLADHGIREGRVFREVFPGRRRNDGKLAGTLRETAIDRNAFEGVFIRAAIKSGVAIDPVTQQRRHVTTHGARAGMITAAVEAGMEIAQIAPHTGHALESPVIHRYYRSGRRWGMYNPGTRIRLARKAARAGQAN